MTKKSAPALTDAKGMGGIHAQAGFEYQVWDALARLPEWLKNPAFEGLGNEMLEDIEARFFTPHTPKGHVLDRFQAKSAQPTKGEVTDVIKGFQEFETNYPGVARVQTLVTPALPPALQWLYRDTDRVRRARPFYAPFDDVKAGSDAKLRSDLRDEFGDDLGDFFCKSVEISLSQMPNAATAATAFATEFHRVFPEQASNFRLVHDAHAALFELCRSNRGRLISRSEILTVMREKLQTEFLSESVLPLHILSDRNASRDDAVEIDARTFAGGDVPFPEPQAWQKDLLDPLAKTGAWAKARSVERISLSGAYRLSTALAIGWAFRSATGFEIEIPTRSGIWPTDVHPSASESSMPWAVSYSEKLLGNRLIVGIGVLRNPMQGIVNTYAGATEENVLNIHLPAALEDPLDAQSSVRTIKGAVDQACTRLKPAAINLFFAGPAALAVALGHRWNGLPQTQLHEYISTDGKYIPAIVIG